MKILVAGDDSAFEHVATLFARRGEMKALRVGTPDEDSLALVWAHDAGDTAEITRLADEGWRVFAVVRDELRTVRAPLLSAGAEDVAADPPSVEWIDACAETVKPSKNRREVRYVATVPWKLSRSGGPVIDGNLVNVSRGGFKIRLLDPPAVGEVLIANFSPETGVPSLYARVLSAEMATQSSWWIRARFVALRKDEVAKLESWLDTLKREDVDPVKALIAIDAMTTKDLRSEINAIGGVRIPAMSPLEMEWITTGHELAAIPLARARAQSVATVLGAAPDLAFNPPIERWLAEIAVAQAIAKDPATKAELAAGRAEAAAQYVESAEKLDAAATSFQRAIGKFLAGEKRREQAEPALSNPAAAPEVSPVVPAAPPVAMSSKGGKQRTAMSIAAAALAPKPAETPAPRTVTRTAFLAAGGAGALLVGIALAAFIALPRGPSGAVAFTQGGVRVREVKHTPGPLVVVDESWTALGDEKRRAAAKLIAKKVGPGTTVLKNLAGKTVAIVPESGEVVLMGE